MKTLIDEIAYESITMEGPATEHHWGRTIRVWLVSEIRGDRNELAIEVQHEPDDTSKEIARLLAKTSLNLLVR